MNSASFVAPSHSSTGLGLHARARLHQDQAIGELAGPRLPSWLLQWPSRAFPIPGTNLLVDGSGEHAPFTAMLPSLQPPIVQSLDDPREQIVQPPRGARWPATYVGLSTRARPSNASVLTRRVGGEARVWLVCKCDIERGEEILVDPSAVAGPPPCASSSAAPAEQQLEEGREGELSHELRMTRGQRRRGKQPAGPEGESDAGVASILSHLPLTMAPPSLGPDMLSALDRQCYGAEHTPGAPPLTHSLHRPRPTLLHRPSHSLHIPRARACRGFYYLPHYHHTYPEVPR